MLRLLCASQEVRRSFKTYCILKDSFRWRRLDGTTTVLHTGRNTELSATGEDFSTVDLLDHSGQMRPRLDGGFILDPANLCPLEFTASGIIEPQKTGQTARTNQRSKKSGLRAAVACGGIPRRSARSGIKPRIEYSFPGTRRCERSRENSRTTPPNGARPSRRKALYPDGFFFPS